MRQKRKLSLESPVANSAMLRTPVVCRFHPLLLSYLIFMKYLGKTVLPECSGFSPSAS